MSKVDRIAEFRGEYRFLSNFYPFPVEFEGILYPTVEHAYQAAKTPHPEGKQTMARLPNPGVAKNVGKGLPLPKDWDQKKLEVMEVLLRKKFQNIDMRERLLATGDAEIVEGNVWGDTFWGKCRGEGENHLGRLLMTIRAELRQAQEF